MKNIAFLTRMVYLLLAVLFILGGVFIYRETGRTLADAAPKPDIQSIIDPVVASIGGTDILRSQLTKNLYEVHGVSLLNQMLDRKAIQMEADETGLVLDPNEIELELNRMRQGYDSEEQFYKSMKEQVGLTKAQLRADTYYILLLERIATKDIVISEKEVDDYLKSHNEEFKNKTHMQLQQIITKTLDQANKAIALLNSGKPFAEVAQERSLDAATANDGGDLGWIEENDPFIPAPILKAALGLKAGDISKPIDLGGEFAVIKLRERKEISKGSVEQIRKSVRKQLALQLAKPLTQVTAELRKKRNAVIIDPDLK